jgi:hypothetical protein
VAPRIRYAASAGTGASGRLDYVGFAKLGPTSPPGDALPARTPSGSLNTSPSKHHG